ncbi:hypothetical protein SPFM12_00276 [Salmonella phage SPFM12]|nr:hypothetical protein SPFM12_00276 [Salmonella phage SPFM12]
MQAPVRRYGVGGQLPYPEGLVEYVVSLAENSVRAKYIIDLLNWISVGETQMYKMIDYTLTGIENSEPSLSDETEYIRRQVDVIAKLLFTIPALLNTGRSLITVDAAYVGSPFVPLQIVDDADNSRQGLPLLSGMLDGTFNEETWKNDLAESQNVCSVFTEAQFRLPLSQMNEQMRFEYNKLKEIGYRVECD